MGFLLFSASSTARPLLSPQLHGGSFSLPDLMPCPSFASQQVKFSCCGHSLAPKWPSPRKLNIFPSQQKSLLLPHTVQAVCLWGGAVYQGPLGCDKEPNDAAGAGRCGTESSAGTWGAAEDKIPALGYSPSPTGVRPGPEACRMHYQVCSISPRAVLAP